MQNDLKKWVWQCMICDAGSKWPTSFYKAHRYARAHLKNKHKSSDLELVDLYKIF